jgi:hypothetical protein
MDGKLPVCKLAALGFLAVGFSVLGALNPAPDDETNECTQRLDLMYVAQCMLVAWTLIFYSILDILDCKKLFQINHSGSDMPMSLLSFWIILSACCTPFQFILLIAPNCSLSYPITVILTYWIVTVSLLIFSVPFIAYGAFLILKVVLFTIPWIVCVSRIKINMQIKRYLRISKYKKQTWSYYKGLHDSKRSNFQDIYRFIVEYHCWKINIKEEAQLKELDIVCSICEEKFEWRDRVFLDPLGFHKFHEICILRQPEFFPPPYWIKISQDFYLLHKNHPKPLILPRFLEGYSLLKPAMDIKERLDQISSNSTIVNAIAIAQ